MPNCEHGPKCYDMNKGHIAFTIKRWRSLLLNVGLLATNVDMSPYCRQLLYVTPHHQMRHKSQIQLLRF